MAQQPFLALVIGIPAIPTVTQVNIRSGPGTNTDLIFKVAVGTTNLPIIEVKADAEGKNKDGKVYQWFRVQFPQGVGWVRDDLINIWGDGTGTGYPALVSPVTAFALTRNTSTLPPGAEIAATGTAPQQTTTTKPTASTEVVTTAQPAVATASQPIVATPQPTSSSEVVTTPQATTSQTTAASGPPMALCISKFGGTMRPGPGTGHNPSLGKFAYKDTASVIGGQVGDDGVALSWVKISYQGKEGWVREDLVRVTGNFTSFGLNVSDKYRVPVDDTWWIRGWDLDGTIWNTGPHNGWDLGGVKGVTPVLAGPQGGVVFDVRFCQKCGTAGTSAVEKGFSVGDSRVWNDAGWNFGYGHFIIVGYENSKLPESTKQYLASNNMAGWNIFVMHAHLQELIAKKGATVAPNEKIAILGNSGNSEGPHLHLEIRASQTMNPGGWANIKSGLMSPGVLFIR